MTTKKQTPEATSREFTEFAQREYRNDDEFTAHDLQIAYRAWAGALASAQAQQEPVAYATREALEAFRAAREQTQFPMDVALAIHPGPAGFRDPVPLYTAPAAAEQPAEPAGLTTCNCRWDGDKQVQQCTLHQAHIDAIHEWAERAKTAEKALDEGVKREALAVADAFLRGQSAATAPAPVAEALTAELSSLSYHLRNGGWNTRAPQEMADIIAIHLDAIASTKKD